MPVCSVRPCAVCAELVRLLLVSIVPIYERMARLDRPRWLCYIPRGCSCQIQTNTKSGLCLVLPLHYTVSHLYTSFNCKGCAVYCLTWFDLWCKRTVFSEFFFSCYAVVHTVCNACSAWMFDAVWFWYQQPTRWRILLRTFGLALVHLSTKRRCRMSALYRRSEL